MHARVDYKPRPPASTKPWADSSTISIRAASRKAYSPVKLRASQINGCAFCIDMHWKDLRAIGENEQRLYGLDAWRESPYLHRTRTGRADLDRSRHAHYGWPRVGCSTTSRCGQHFDGKELADLTLAVATINAWNRLAIAGRTCRAPISHECRVARRPDEDVSTSEAGWTSRLPTCSSRSPSHRAPDAALTRRGRSAPSRS